MKLSNNVKTTLAVPMIGVLAIMFSPAQAAWLVDSSGNPLNRAGTTAPAPAPVASAPAPASMPKPEPVASGMISHVVASSTFAIEDDSRMMEVDKRQFDEEQRRLGRPLMRGQVRAPVATPKPVAPAPAEVMDLQMNREAVKATPPVQAQPMAAPVRAAPVETPVEPAKPSGGVMNLRMGG